MSNNQENNLQKIDNFVIFETESGKVNVPVFFENDTLWLTQKTISELFEKGRSTIAGHLRNIFESGELYENQVCRDFRHTAPDGKKYTTKYYNLRAITAVGYRVNSQRATAFRQWATEILHEYIVKGSVLDVERLKKVQHLGKDYFDETLEKIREIRSSERRLYQKITDIYALSADYDKNNPKTKEFFATVQNKLHWSITGKTASETIYSQADASKIHMGLKTWKNAPKGKILKSDVTIAKNYLDTEHLKQLERIVSAFLDLAENRAQRGIVMNMADWIVYLDKFLEISDYPILTHSGKISALEAKIKAEAEYDEFRINQDREYVSDFDEIVKELLAKKAEEA
jgi:hypothetical protein